MLNQMTTMRLPDGSEVAFVDWQDKPLFSSLDFLTGFTDSDLEAFTYVPGDTIPSTNNVTIPRTATEQNTNVSTPGSMASTEEMLVYAIRPYYIEGVLDQASTDYNTFNFGLAGQPAPSTSSIGIMQALLTLRLIVSQKAEQEAPLAYFNTGFGAYGGVSQQTAALASRGTAGFPTQEAVRSYVIPVHIGGQEKYRVQLANDGGNTVAFGVDQATPPVELPELAMTVVIHLDGLYKRPVT